MPVFRVTISTPAANEDPIVMDFTFPSEADFLKARDAAQAAYAKRKPQNVKLWRISYEIVG